MEVNATTREKPTFRGVLHAGALVPTVLSGALLVASREGEHRLPLIAHSAGFASMLATSALYHRLPYETTTSDVVRRADHAMIFAAMAGTMTPVATAALSPKVAQRAVAGLWGVAAVGAALKVAFLGSSRDPGRYLYLPLGWAGAALMVGVYQRSGAAAVAEFAAGGAIYTLGSATLATKRPDPRPDTFGYHEVWHLATIVAGA